MLLPMKHIFSSLRGHLHFLCIFSSLLWQTFFFTAPYHLHPYFCFFPFCSEITKELCDMKVFLMGLGMVIGADYTGLGMILEESRLKRTSLVSPFVEHTEGVDIDSLVTSIINLIKEGEA